MALLAGKEQALEVNFRIDESFAASDISVQIVAQDVAEYNTNNNYMLVAVGAADVKITDTAIGPNKLSISVKNVGFEATSEIVISLTNEAKMPLQTKTIASISPRDTVTVEFDEDLTALQFENGFGEISVAATADSDSNESNNSETIYVKQSLLVQTYEVALHAMTNNASGSVLNSSVKNNLQCAKNALIIAGVYNEKNALVSLKMESRELIPEDYTTLDFVFDGVPLKNTYKIKLFILEETPSYAAIGSAKEYLCADYLP